jgi:phosphoribosylamine--glycine ligase
MESLIDLYWDNFGEKGSLILEELLSGFEISIIGITDGKACKLFQASQDHKRLLDNDEGPNTGGMGAYTPVKLCTPDLLEKIEETIIEPTLQGLQREQLDYKGFIYFGILVQDSIPYLLEYNVRLGDPETQVLLPSLKSDLVATILETLDGNLENVSWEFSPEHFVTVALVSGGYPGTIHSGYEIKGLDRAREQALIFLSGVKLNEQQQLIKSGGRVINVVASAPEFPDALLKAYAACEKIHFENMFYRHDIGRKNL